MKSTGERVHEFRAEWSYGRLKKWVQPGETVLNLGAGDCRLDLLLQNRVGCRMTPVDVEDFNETPLNLALYDGKTLPYPDQSFDVVLLLWVLHHAEDPVAVMREARRVSRRTVIVFEDQMESLWDRLVFRGFHRFLRWSQGFSLPHHEWDQSEWLKQSSLAGLKTTWCGPLGRQLGPMASATVGFLWEPRSMKPLTKGRQLPNKEWADVPAEPRETVAPGRPL